MTHPRMLSRYIAAVLLAVALVLPLAGLTGCSTVHGWAHGGSSHPAVAGASVSVPLGK